MSKLIQNQEGPGGRVYVISTGTGKVLRSFPVPFERESWSVPILYQTQDKLWIIYGSGGERQGGFIQAQDILTGQVMWHVESKRKGIISSPIMYHENGQAMVISNSMNGEILKLNADTGELIWRKLVSKNFETYSSPAVIKTDSGVDIISLFSYGVWPKYNFTSMFVFDGATGENKFRQQIGFCFGAVITNISRC